MSPYPPKLIVLANGKKMVIRQAVREDVPAILKSVHPCLFIEARLLRYRQRPPVR